MPTITALERQKKNKERINIYIDGEFAFGLPEIDAVKLRKGQEVTDEEIVELREIDAVARAVEVGIQLLSYRPRSVAEVRQKLVKKETPEPIIATALDRLQTLGYLSDEAFARFWIENRSQFKPRSVRALSYELQQKGVARSVIDALVNDMVDEEDAAYRAGLQKVRRYRGKPQSEFETKLGAFLQRRGFHYGIIRGALDRLIEELCEDDPHFFADVEDGAID